MTPHDAFLADIIAHPGDDAPRLIYADWLEEHGQPERADFIRVQCEIPVLEKKLENPTLLEIARSNRLYSQQARDMLADIREKISLLQKREGELLAIGQWAWVHCVSQFVVPNPRVDWLHYPWKFRRGFIEIVTCTCQTWLDYGSAILAACPTIREVPISDYRPYVFDVNDPQLSGWIYGINAYAPFNVPEAIWEHLAGRKHFISGLWVCTYEKWGEDSVQCDDAAREDLSQAAIAYARSCRPVTA